MTQIRWGDALSGRITCASGLWSAARRPPASRSSRSRSATRKTPRTSTRARMSTFTSATAPAADTTCMRPLARHMGRLIAGNPAIVPKNMPGAGSLVLANWLYNVAPKDGTAFGTIGRGTAFDPLLGSTKAQFDASKFNWIGSMNDEVSVCVAWHTTGITRLEQVMQKEITVGGTGPVAHTDQFPKVLDATICTKFRNVTGYPGGNESALAMERGEVMGRCGWSWSSVVATHRSWIDENKISVLVQLALGKHPDLPNVPLVMDLARNNEE